MALLKSLILYVYKETYKKAFSGCGNDKHVFVGWMPRRAEDAASSPVGECASDVVQRWCGRGRGGLRERRLPGAHEDEERLGDERERLLRRIREYASVCDQLSAPLGLQLVLLLLLLP